MAKVTIINGAYKGTVLNNQEFELNKAYNSVTGCITVWGDERIIPKHEIPRRCRIKVDPSDFLVTYDPSEVSEQNEIIADEIEDYKAAESEEMAIERIEEVFSHLAGFTTALVGGGIKGMIVVGPSGVGKSHEVKQILEEEKCYREIDGKNPEFYEIIKGSISASYLYRKLWEFKGSDNVLVLDDCELEDTESYNMVKAALDSSETREISWYKQALWLADEGIDPKFEFKGSMIFLTNVPMDSHGGAKGKHLSAVVSRCHYLDLDMDCVRDKLLRIKQVVRKGMLDKYEFRNHEDVEVVDFIVKHADNLLDLSPRMATKIADLRKQFPRNW